jgi:hypothetical protein
MIWYHGDTGDREHFEDQRWDRDKDQDRNAAGPGIYFTERLDQAQGYGKHVYAAKLTSAFKFMPRKKPTLKLLRKFYDAVSREDQYYFLSNWTEEPDTARPDVVLQKYVDFRGGMIGALLTLRNDLVQDPADWIRAARATGYHGYIVQLPEVRHLIVWDPTKLTIRKIT